jgi:NTE family protein
VAGISIGAIDSAIIAGNRPEDRVERLTALWDAISRPDCPRSWRSQRGRHGTT